MMNTEGATEPPAIALLVNALGYLAGRAHFRVGVWLDNLPGFTDGSISGAYKNDPNFEE